MNCRSRGSGAGACRRCRSLKRRNPSCSLDDRRGRGHGRNNCSGSQGHRSRSSWNRDRANEILLCSGEKAGHKRHCENHPTGMMGSGCFWPGMQGHNESEEKRGLDRKSGTELGNSNHIHDQTDHKNYCHGEKEYWNTWSLHSDHPFPNHPPNQNSRRSDVYPYCHLLV